MNTIDTAADYIIHYHFNELVKTDRQHSLSLESVLEKETFLCPAAGTTAAAGTFTFSHRVLMLMNHRTILVDKFDPEKNEGTLTAEIYRQRINQKLKRSFSSYRIPVFFKWVVLNPRKFYRLIDQEIMNWMTTIKSQREAFSNDQSVPKVCPGCLDDQQVLTTTVLCPSCIQERDSIGRSHLTILVICRFICLENEQYFGRASRSERAEKLFHEFASIFEDRAFEVLKFWQGLETSTPSTILSNLSLERVKYNADGELKVNEYVWKKRNIIDIARLGKMHKLIRSGIMDAYDEPVFSTNDSWPRKFKFMTSLILLGLPAPILMNYTKEIYLKRTFWNDMKGRTYAHDTTNQKTQKAQPDRDAEFYQSRQKGFWKHWLIFHSSQTVKLGYSFLSEFLFMLYFSFYIRNKLLYKWTSHDSATIGAILVMIFGRIKAYQPHLSRETSDIAKPFKSSTHIQNWFTMLLVYVISMVLRGSYTLMTPDVVYAPVIESTKFSSESVNVVQNDYITFIASSEMSSHPASNISYYNDIYNTKYELRGYKSARQLDGVFSPLFFSYDPDKAPNYELGMNIFNGLILGIIIGVCCELMLPILDHKRRYGWWLWGWVITGSIVGAVDGFDNSIWFHIYGVSYSTWHIIIVIAIGIGSIIIFSLMYGCKTTSRNIQKMETFRGTTFLFYSSVIAFFVAYPFFGASEDVHPNFSSTYSNGTEWPKQFRTQQCNIRYKNSNVYV